VRSLGDVPQLFAPGEQFSYNNAGYCVLGRLVEVLREKPYAQCLRDQLFTPLGLTTASNGADDAILHRAAVGHIRPDDDAEQIAAPIWSMAWSNAPAGSQLAMSAADLLAFARMHLADGVASDGTVVLSPESVAAMRRSHVELPPLGLLGENWGLGWELYSSPAGQMIAHDGNTIGQASYMRIVPEREVAIVMLTNGGDGVKGYRAVFEHLLNELAGFALKPLPAPPTSPVAVDASRLVGTYSAQAVDLNVTQDADGRVWVEQVPKGVFADMGETPRTTELVGYQGDTLIPATPIQGMFIPHAFVGDDGHGKAQYLHIGRAMRRADVTA
jgi:CubicO group peptidase (beta-lactamase class C family)